MAVYTEVSFDEAAQLFDKLKLGRLQSLKACEGGIENTNYFADTEGGRYVLTLFERLTFEQLPFYLHLMKHLAGCGIPVPDPALDASGAILYKVKGKPAAVVNRLRGSSQLQPAQAHCAQVGGMLARMHLASQSFELQQPNLRALPWWNDTLSAVLPHVTAEQRSLLLGELAYQNHVQASSAFKALPVGIIHADLFRDNVMFEGDELTGFFDFYFAGVDTFLFDIAVCLNDWCIDLASGRLEEDRATALVGAYHAVRPLSADEHRLLPAMLRAGALRFWISRLWDLHLPRDATMLTPHDPSHFERVLSQRVEWPWHPALTELGAQPPHIP
jgi:homoserine kinase type II